MKKITSLPILILIFAALVGASSAHAANLSGWGWSSNVGWVSFSCANTSTCGQSNYNVSVDAFGNLTGDAWSSNLGWIQFGGLSSFPGTGGNVTVSTSTGTVTGWIRACAGTADGKCASMTSRTDGWDGWIKLSDSSTYASPNSSGTGGVTYIPSTGKFVGYTWGNNVVGWLAFNPTLSGSSSTTVTTVGCDTCVNDSSSFTVGGGTITAVSPFPVTGANTYITVTGSGAANQTIHLSVTGLPAGFSNAATSPSTCNLTSSVNSCTIQVSVTIPSSGFSTFTVVGTRASDSVQKAGQISVNAQNLSSAISLWTTSPTNKNNNSYIAMPSQNVPLFWSVGTGLGQCSGVVASKPAGASSAGNWASAKPSVLNSPSSVSSNLSSPLMLATKGTYTLALACEQVDDQGNAIQDANGNTTTVTSSPVNVTVTTSTIKEI